MPVYKDTKRGTWFISYTYKDPVTGKHRTTKKRGFPTKREAIKAENDMILANATSSKTTFAQMVKLWEDTNQASPSTRDKNKSCLKRFPLRDKPVESISKAELSRWRADLAKDDTLSTTTKNQLIRTVKATYTFAYQVYDLPNTAAFLKALKKTDSEVLQEMDVWTPEEFSQFLEAVDHPVFRAMFSFMFWTGCRRGEAIGLQKADVTENDVLIKYSQIDQSDGLKPTKTKAIRRVKIDPFLWDQLKPLMDQPGSYVFGGETGVAPSAVFQEFKRAIKASGVKEIRLHDLRHSHATWLINNGINIVAVSRRLGHATINTTLKTYTHLLESSDNDLLAKITDFKENSCQSYATDNKKPLK